MLNFLKEDFDYQETYIIYSKIIKKLDSLNAISYKNFINSRTPLTKENIIEALKDIVPHSKILTDIISEDLNIKSFDSLIDINYKDCILVKEGVFYNNVFYTINPYSNKIDKVKELMNNEEVVFKEIGIISDYDLENLNIKIKELSTNKINSLIIDKKIQDLISIAINTKAHKIKIYPTTNSISIEFLKDSGYIPVNIELGNIKDYSTIIEYIDSKFKELNIWRHNDKNHKLLYNKEDYVINEEKYSIIYFTLYSGNEILSLEEFNIPFKEKAIFDKAVKSPSGIILVSGKMNSGKRERIYSILNHIKETSPQLSITTIEDVVKKEIDFISQLEIGLNNNFDYQKFNSEVLGYYEIRNREDFEYILSEASKGKLVVAGINSLNSINAISKVLSFEINNKLFSELLLCVIHSNLILKVCPYCSNDYKFINDKNYNLFIDLENSPNPNTIIKKADSKGCYHCISGYKDKVIVTELLNNDHVLTEEIISSFNTEKIKLEKRSVSWKNCFESAIEKVKEGEITINSLIDSLGFYKK